MDRERFASDKTGRPEGTATCFALNPETPRGATIWSFFLKLLNVELERKTQRKPFSTPTPSASR
jgi:hypothetical protein